MLRRLFGLFAILSALLTLLFIALWARRAAHVDEFELSLRGREWYVYSYDEGISFIVVSGSPYPVTPAWYSREASDKLDLIRRERTRESWKFERFGFRYTLGECRNPDDLHSPRMTFRSLHLPHWGATTFGSIVPIVWIRRAIRHRATLKERRRKGECLACGYDLRASSDRCPECGATVVSLERANAT